MGPYPVRFVAREIIKNVALGTAPGLTTRALANTHRSHMDHARLAENYEASFGHYRALLEKVEPGYDLAGRTVAEIGPGPALWTALLFVLDGAEKVWCVDRYPRATGPVEQRLYEAFWARRTPAQRQALAGVLRRHKGRWEVNPTRVEYVCERAERMRLPPVDLTCSWTVMEHVRDPGQTLANLARHTGPGGLSVHHVDLSGHWLSPKDDPLAFLKLEDWSWNLMTWYQGAPNRVRYSHYLPLFERAGFEVRHLEKVRELDADEVERQRSSLATPFRDLSTEDLAVLSFRCVLQKRA